MKAVISNRIYLEVTREYKEFLSKELTYKIPSPNPKDPPIVIKNMARVREGLGYYTYWKNRPNPRRL